jgi:anti-sigma factor RsiW
MTCEQLYERLTDLAEGTLAPDVCEEVNRHLAGCAECQRLREELEVLSRLCRETSTPTTMPAEVRGRIVALLADPAPGAPVTRRS